MASLGLLESAQSLRKEYIEIEGVEELINKVYNRLLVEDSEFSGLAATSYLNGGAGDKRMGKILRREARRVLGAVQTQMRKAAKSAMNGDPRKASQAVKRSIWRKAIGGSVSLYNNKGSRRYMANVQRTNARAGQVGGNRRKVSARTEQVDSYWGADRAFILRYINEGTGQRSIGIRGDVPKVKRPGSRGGHSTYGARGTGNRGCISARNFFATSKGVMATEAGKMTQTLENFINSVDMSAGL